MRRYAAYAPAAEGFPGVEGRWTKAGAAPAGLLGLSAVRLAASGPDGRLPAGSRAATETQTSIDGQEARVARLAPEPRIMIVEDEWFIAIESEAILTGRGYRVVGTATSADEAVALAERERPDLVLMDIRLRGTRDGVDAALEIHRRFGIVCVFATAHSEPTLQTRAADACPAGWLTKPFSERQLIEAVERALESRG
ncbi:response regulator [Faunimonas sp. B44]|uniref:response regulator n=1 Tax=Faunimonas sp. B44 TaxID=3461493 RepID=UPI0040445504